MIEIFCNTSLFFVIVSFAIKTVIYTRLDYRNGHQIKYGNSWGRIDLTPYKNAVSAEDEKLKARCNVVHNLSMIFLAIFLISCAIRLLQKI